MRKHFIALLGLLVSLSILVSACAPQSTPTVPAAPTQEIDPTTVSPIENPVTGGSGLEDVDPGDVTGNIITAGSSTVYPLSEAVINLFELEGYQGRITADSIGTGAGFERFCKSGETDIANASRPIRDSERESCQAIGRDPIEFRVGTDALAVVVNPQNDFLTDVTLAELGLIFSDQVTRWSDVNPDWPNEAIKRYAPGTDSGTYDYFIEAVMQPAFDKDARKGMEAFQNANPQQSEDDNVLVQGVEGDPYAIGYFGFAYLKEQGDRLKALSVEGVEPNLETAESGQYPLARPIFIYSDARIIAEKPQVAAFIAFYLTRVNEVIEEVGYFPASEQAMEVARQNLIDALP